MGKCPDATFRWAGCVLQALNANRSPTNHMRPRLAFSRKQDALREWPDAFSASRRAQRTSQG